MTLKHHWLVAGNVIAAAPMGKVGQKGINVMVLTGNAYFTREDLAVAQDAMMQRFVEETPQEQNSKIVDAFILSISHLGAMTTEVFNGSLASPEPEAK